jgi:hypothetical protein
MMSGVARPSLDRPHQHAPYDSGAPLRRLGDAPLLDVAARLLFAVGLVGTLANLLAGDTLLPPRALLVVGPCGLMLMFIAESRVSKLRAQFGLPVRGRRLWSATSDEERAALHGAGLRRLELTHRAGTIASWTAVWIGVVLGLIVLSNP